MCVCICALSRIQEEHCSKQLVDLDNTKKDLLLLQSRIDRHTNGQLRYRYGVWLCNRHNSVCTIHTIIYGNARDYSD